LNFEYFISKRLFRQKDGGFTSPIIKLATISIALGVTTMIISMSIARGFQSTIKEKVAGFEGHIRISKFDYNKSYELSPITIKQDIEAQLEQNQKIESASHFAIKGGIIKYNGIMEGVILKGVDGLYNHRFFDDCLVSGRFPKFNDSTRSKEILISKTLADKLNIEAGKKLLMYFIQDPPRIRKFTVTGIYNSGFSEFDTKYIIGDLQQIQKLNRWDEDQISGYEIMLKHFSDIDFVNKQIYKIIDYDVKSETLMQRYPTLIDWLNLLDTNVLFIIGLMILISGITIISTLLILILDKTNLIGTLKALGATTKSIRRIFILNSISLIIKGLVIGNIIGIGLALIQKQFELIPLDPENYYMNTVPIALDFDLFALLNLATLTISLIMLLWPSTIIARISPVKAIRFR